MPHRIYFCVPNFTGYGPEFDTFDEARDYVNARWTSELVRQFISVRVSDGRADREIARFEMKNLAAAGWVVK